MCSFEQKATSPNSATLNFYKVCSLENQFSHQFSYILALIWTFSLKNERVHSAQNQSPRLEEYIYLVIMCPHLNEWFTKSEIK